MENCYPRFPNDTYCGRTHLLTAKIIDVREIHSLKLAHPQGTNRVHRDHGQIIETLRKHIAEPGTIWQQSQWKWEQLSPFSRFVIYDNT